MGIRLTTKIDKLTMIKYLKERISELEQELKDTKSYGVALYSALYEQLEK